jgi:Family of unknown function (DUF6960)
MPQPQIGQFGLYPWRRGLDGDCYVHPDDIERFDSRHPISEVFEVAGRCGAFIILRNGDGQYRVKPDLFDSIPTPAHSFGDTVTVIKQQQKTTGTVCKIMWHIKRHACFYFIVVDGKQLKKRYWDEDMQ